MIEIYDDRSLIDICNALQELSNIEGIWPEGFEDQIWPEAEQLYAQMMGWA